MSQTKEPATGISLPEVLLVPGTKELQLIGAGVREKRVAVINVKVYAAAFYADVAEAKEAVSKFKGTSGNKLQKDEFFFKAIAEGTFDKSLTMVLNRDISGDQFAGGLQDSLSPILKSLGAPAETESAFISAFKGIPLKNSTRIFLGFSGSTTTVTVVSPSDVTADFGAPDGAKSTVVDSAELVQALNQIYLGEKPISPSLKKAIAEGAASRLWA